MQWKIQFSTTLKNPDRFSLKEHGQKWVCSRPVYMFLVRPFSAKCSSVFHYFMSLAVLRKSQIQETNVISLFLDWAPWECVAEQRRDTSTCTRGTWTNSEQGMIWCEKSPLRKNRKLYHTTWKYCSIAIVSMVTLGFHSQSQKVKNTLYNTKATLSPGSLPFLSQHHR